MRTSSRDSGCFQFFFPSGFQYEELESVGWEEDKNAFGTDWENNNFALHFHLVPAPGFSKGSWTKGGKEFSHW